MDQIGRKPPGGRVSVPRFQSGARGAAFGWVALYLLAVLTPLFLAYVLRPQTDHGDLYEVGKGFALLGITILALQFVLGARLSWIENAFGLDILVLFHRFMGVFATVLLLAHPVVLVLGGHEGTLLYSPAVEWYIWVGRIALLTLVVHAAVSLFRISLRIEFQRWLRMHKVLAFAVIVLGLLHSWFSGGDLAGVPMRILWMALFAIVLSAIVYRRYLQPRRLRRRPYRVVDVLRETHNVWTIKLAPPESTPPLPYVPGQFHFLTLYRAAHPVAEEHPFTISSSPTQAAFLSSTIKESGDFTATIGRAEPGDIAVIHGPFGRFSYLCHPGERDLVFVAGGVGVTPFMSMLRHMRDTRAEIQVTLVYANRTRGDIVFYDELAQIEAGKQPELRLIHVLSSPGPDWDGEVGRVDARKVSELCGGNLSSKSFYLCGPPQMSKGIVRDLQKLGVSEARIHVERFSL